MQNLIGANEEVEFWKEFIKTDRFLNGWVKEGRTPELRQEVAEFLWYDLDRSSKVLDVGSGVVSILNGLPYDITAVDPLGNEYAKIFDYEAFGIRPPLPYAAENLPFQDDFDIVHMSNAIDHSIDPVIAYNKLFDAVIPGGYLILQGFFNEGTNEKWQGMHQWNIYVEDNVLVVEDKKGNRREMAHNPFRVTIYEFDNKKWYVWICAK